MRDRTNLARLLAPNQRPPDWKGRVAKHYAETGEVMRRMKGGNMILAATQFARALLAKPPRERWVPSESWSLQPTSWIGPAWMIYTSTLQRIRWELEARLVTPDSHEAIGRKMGISPILVDAYGQLYFDVRDRPDSYIAAYVLDDDEREFAPAKGRALL